MISNTTFFFVIEITDANCVLWCFFNVEKANLLSLGLRKPYQDLFYHFIYKIRATP